MDSLLNMRCLHLVADVNWFKFENRVILLIFVFSFLGKGLRHQSLVSQEYFSTTASGNTAKQRWLNLIFSDSFVSNISVLAGGRGDWNSWLLALQNTIFLSLKIKFYSPLIFSFLYSICWELSFRLVVYWTWTWIYPKWSRDHKENGGILYLQDCLWQWH